MTVLTVESWKLLGDHHFQLSLELANNCSTLASGGFPEDALRDSKLLGMYSYSESYQLRQYYLQEQQVPTENVINRKMTSNPAVLFKFLNSKLKVIAGLEPPLQGGGSNWYGCPKEVLFENRAVLKPLAHEILTKINHFGVEHLGLQILVAKHKKLRKKESDIQQESNDVWENVKTFRQEQWNKNTNIQSKIISDHIKYAFELFSAMYRSSFNSTELVFHEGLINDIKMSLQKTRLKMKNRYDILSKSQVLLITHEATKKLKKEKTRLKAKFIENLEICRTEMTDRLHDLTHEKHVASIKLRTLLEYQKLACQIYVYLKEKEEGLKELEERRHEHKRYVKHLTKASALLNFEANITEENEKIRQENNSVWLQKVSHVVKNFQMLVSYCLNTLPDQAEFFINMERLMLLQVTQVLEDPNAGSIIAVGQEQFHSPVPQPKSFYLFCDRGYKTKEEQDLCTKHSCTSSTSELPVIIVNKQCLYAACDNFKQFSNKIKDFINDNRGDDADIKDDLVYEHFVPVKYTSLQQLTEIKLRSSLLQILQQEMCNINNVPLAAHDRTVAENANNTLKKNDIRKEQEVRLVPPQVINNTPGPSANIRLMEHEREPKLEKFLRYTEPKACGCAKSCKKHLAEHLPTYMRKTSKFDSLVLPNYETCSVTALKKLVKDARAQKISFPKDTISSKTKDMSTQYSDEKFDFLCTCFSHSNLAFDPGRAVNHFSLESLSPSYMTRTQSKFAVDRANSLRQLIEGAPELLEIFNKENR